jgi:hypothetical protein
MESNNQIVFRAIGDANERGTNRVHFFYKVIGDGVCERIGYSRRKYMTYKNPKIFKFTKEVSYSTSVAKTQTWDTTYRYNVQDEDSKDYGYVRPSTHSVNGVPQY